MRFDPGPEGFVLVNRNYVLTEYVQNKNDCRLKSTASKSQLKTATIFGSWCAVVNLNFTRNVYGRVGVWNNSLAKICLFYQAAMHEFSDCHVIIKKSFGDKAFSTYKHWTFWIHPYVSSKSNRCTFKFDRASSYSKTKSLAEKKRRSVCSNFLKACISMINTCSRVSTINTCSHKRENSDPSFVLTTIRIHCCQWYNTREQNRKTATKPSKRLHDTTALRQDPPLRLF